jgi:hypothetical protein
MIQQLITPDITITQRLRIVKNILALALMASLCFTFSWWLPTDYYPKIALYSVSFHAITDYILLGFFFISLLFMFLYRSPKFFVFLSTICLLFAVFTDVAKGQYWLFFYLGMLLLLCGHNWRIDTPRRYSAVITTIKFLVCFMYVLSAIQFFNTSISGTMWLQFIAPLERVCTPEQHTYLLGIRYVVPFIEFFIAVGLFIDRVKMAAIIIAICLHVFSFGLLLLETPYSNAGVLIWNACMILLIYFLFAGKTSEQKTYNFSFNLYGTCILLVAIFGGLVKQDLFPENKIDLMQSNNTEQFIYMNKSEKNRLPLYIQYFTTNTVDDVYSKLSVTNWCANETKTKQVLSNKQLLKVCAALKIYCGTNTDMLATIPPEKNKTIAVNSR